MKSWGSVGFVGSSNLKTFQKVTLLYIALAPYSTDE
jgi:hypothetical protein